MSHLILLIPFCGLLFSIAFLPIIDKKFWERNYYFVSLFWSLLTIVASCLTCKNDWHHGLLTISHTLFIDFFPFIVLIGSLYIIAGVIIIRLGFRGTPLTNTCMLGALSLLASVFGTTGAALIGIRPLIAINKDRSYVVHTFVFFVFLVCNIGGCLSAIGDPPLFLGFLKGVPFFWPLQNLWKPFLMIFGCLLVIYYLCETWHWRKDTHARGLPPLQETARIYGKRQVGLAVLLIFVLVGTARLPMGELTFGGLSLPGSGLLRSVLLCFLASVSFILKPLNVRKRQGWHLHPLTEIAILFAGIFITADPPLQMLSLGKEGPLGEFLSFVSHEGESVALAYFWLAGFFSSFLDNAPTYLIFFTMAGGDVGKFMNESAPLLAAISAGAVFMGALTYIGNAPNLLVKTILEEEYNIRMPSFFGYILWSFCILVPLFGVMGFIFWG